MNKIRIKTAVSVTSITAMTLLSSSFAYASTASNTDAFAKANSQFEQNFSSNQQRIADLTQTASSIKSVSSPTYLGLVNEIGPQIQPLYQSEQQLYKTEIANFTPISNPLPYYNNILSGIHDQIIQIQLKIRIQDIKSGFSLQYAKSIKPTKAKEESQIANLQGEYKKVVLTARVAQGKYDKVYKFVKDVNSLRLVILSLQQQEISLINSWITSNSSSQRNMPGGNTISNSTSR